MKDGTTNVRRPRFDEPRDQPGFTCLRARVGRQAEDTEDTEDTEAAPASGPSPPGKQ